MQNFYITEYSKKYYTEYDVDKEIKRPLKVEEVNRGIILPLKVINDYEPDEFHQGGVIDKNGCFCSLSGTKRYGTDYRSLQSGYELEDDPEYCDETVIYGGVLYEFYGHVLLETMSRLWYYYKSNPNHYRVVMDVVPRARGKFKEFFELLDIPYDEKTFITKPTRYKKVIIPEQASAYATNWHKDWLIPFDYMAAKVPAGKYEKIYFTRTKLIERNPVWGEKPIEKIFKKNGYKVFSPERLSLKKQISLMKGCKELVTVASSTYHNLLFAKSGVKLICLNRSFEPDNSQFPVDQAKNLEAIYIDASLNPLPVTHVHGPWIIGITQELKAFLNDNKMKYEVFKGMEPKYVVYFFHEWKWRNNDMEFTAEEVRFMSNRINIDISKSYPKVIYKLLSKITFGKLKKKFKQKSQMYYL